MRVKIAIAVLTLTVVAAGFFDRQTFVAEAQQAAPQLTGDVIVKFNDGTTLAGVGAALDRAEAAPVQSTPSGAVLLQPDPGQSVPDAVASLNGDPNVAYAEPDVLVTIDATPNDTYYGNQAWHFNQINAPAAWDVETGVPGTVIAVIDTGVQSVHPDLNDNMVSGANFVIVPIASSSAGGGGKIRINTSTAHPYLNGEQVTITGHSVGAANGTRTITVPAALNISSSTVSGGVITITTSSAHGLLVGNYVMVRDHSMPGSNGEFVVTATPSSTQFRYACSSGCTSGSGSGGVAKQASWFDLNGTTYTSAGTSGTVKNVSPRDDEGHGTFVSGLVAAESNNAAGAAGVCWDCSIMPVKVLGATGTGSSLAVAAGIEWAVDNGADVLNLSLASPSSTQAMQDAVDYAWANGVIVVAASGNDNSTVKYPAAYPNAIAVGATDSNGLRASFSNFGPQLDVVAPGVSVMSTLATGFGDSGGWYGWGSGTSFSSPQVAGVVGLMISNGITDKNQIVSALTSTAVDAGPANFDNEYGHGIVDTAAAIAGGVDTTPPTVSITAPANGATVSGTVTFGATASDASGVEKVRFWVDNLYLSFDSSAPYSKSWNTTTFSNGPHTLKAQAVDNAGNLSPIVTITVTVSNSDSTPPSVNITSPSNGATVSGTVTFGASASDASGVEKVRFWVDNSYLSFDSSAPYSKSWNTTAFTNGVHTLKAQAVDNAGNLSPIVTITVTVSNSDATPPSVNITSPSNGATLSGTVVITATASDDTAVQKVRFWLDATYLSFDATAPYTRTLDTTTLPNGTHQISVQAVDLANNVSSTVTITVTVAN